MQLQCDIFSLAWRLCEAVAIFVNNYGNCILISIPQPSWGYFFNGRSPVLLAASKGGWYGLTLAKRLLNVLPTYFLLNIASISNLYDICGSNLYIMKYCVIYFECPPFDVFFSSFQTAIIFYIKRSFYALLTSLNLSLNHEGFRVVFYIQ